MASSAPLPPWSEIPPDILGLIIDRLDGAVPDNPTRRRFTAMWILGAVYYITARDNRDFQALCRVRQSALATDRARFRAVCRSWHSAMHLVTPRLLPWVITTGGSFLSSPTEDDKGPRRRLPTFPENARCIGSTDDWIALDCTDAKNMHTYSLHNPFSNTTVPLPELADIIGNVSKLFEVRKVLMRSTPCDVVAILTNNWNYPVILVWPGKGVWLPQPHTAPFIYIIDIAFIGDKLYGITQAEDLVSLAIDFDSHGIPNITGVERLIRHPPRFCRLDVWRDDLDDDDDNFEANIGEYGFPYYECRLNQEGYQKDRALDELREKTGDDMLLDGVTCLRDNEAPDEPKDLVTVIWHLVESCGKLLMVRRMLRLAGPHYGIMYTRKVEVFQACERKGVWMPLSDGLGGRALFISRRFSKSISVYRDVRRDTVYFVDTGEMFNVKTKTLSPPQRRINYRWTTWIFSPELLV